MRMRAVLGDRLRCQFLTLAHRICVKTRQSPSPTPPPQEDRIATQHRYIRWGFASLRHARGGGGGRGACSEPDQSPPPHLSPRGEDHSKDNPSHGGKDSISVRGKGGPLSSNGQFLFSRSADHLRFEPLRERGTDGGSGQSGGWCWVKKRNNHLTPPPPKT